MLQTTSVTSGESILSDYCDANAKRVSCDGGKVRVGPDQGGLLRDTTDGRLEEDRLRAGDAGDGECERVEEAEMLKCDPLLCKMASVEVRGKGSNHRFNIGSVCNYCKRARPLHSKLCHRYGDYVHLGVTFDVVAKNGEVEERFQIPGLRSWDGFDEANVSDTFIPENDG